MHEAHGTTIHRIDDVARERVAPAETLAFYATNNTALRKQKIQYHTGWG
ncbi:MAG TPA: hypothetical protein PLW55_14365 [Leptospiraceae bacterium]|jgi:hypothetical protein|nr:hypothetical protein [Leptospiraceae bacterium]HNJ05093.1 hypothetical protein [Leptospiraceae bacterium]HQI20528.1 hypothetical protein [Leptospiraceae bacterium]